jgi:hypothetical protein
MFIRDDEHILLMETDHRRFTIDELKSFVGVGIGTMLSLQYWFLLESEMGIYD